MPVSLQPHSSAAPELRFQPSLLSVPSAAATVAPETPAERALPKPSSRRHLWFFVALSAFGGLVGSSAFGGSKDVASHVHSGSPGYKHTKSGLDLHWKKPGINVYLDASLTKLGPGGPEAVMQAFGQWIATDKNLPALTFDTVHGKSSPQQDGKSTVSFGPITTPGHQHDLAITVTYANEDTGEIVEADVILNSAYPFGVLSPKSTTPKAESGLLPGKADREHGKASAEAGEAGDCRNRYDAQNVATHEAGHFFGLGEDPVSSKAAMFQSIDQCELHKRTLATSDVDAIGTLYAHMADPEEVKVGARACSFGPASSSPVPLWLSSVVLGFSLLRRRRGR